MAKILIVDDDPDCVALLALHVQHRGYDVETASNGPDALELASLGQIELMLLDFRMPNVDGIRVIEILRGNALTASMPVILMSAADADKEWAARELQPDPLMRFLEKPIDFPELDRQLVELLPAVSG